MTLTPGSAAPDSSTMVPSIVPLTDWDWANDEDAAERTTNRTNMTRNTRNIELPPERRADTGARETTLSMYELQPQYTMPAQLDS